MKRLLYWCIFRVTCWCNISESKRSVSWFRQIIFGLLAEVVLALLVQQETCTKQTCSCDSVDHFELAFLNVLLKSQIQYYLSDYTGFGINFGTNFPKCILEYI